MDLPSPVFHPYRRHSRRSGSQTPSSVDAVPVIGRMKSRSSPDAMYEVKPFASRGRKSSIIGGYAHAEKGRSSVG